MKTTVVTIIIHIIIHQGGLRSKAQTWLLATADLSRFENNSWWRKHINVACVPIPRQSSSSNITSSKQWVVFFKVSVWEYMHNDNQDQLLFCI